MAKTALQLLIDARELVKDHWWYGSMAVTRSMEQYPDPWRLDTCAWCVSGAIMHVAGIPPPTLESYWNIEEHEPEVQEALRALASFLPFPADPSETKDTTIACVAGYNDRQGIGYVTSELERAILRGQPTPAPEAVLEWIDQAIAKLEQENG